MGLIIGQGKSGGGGGGASSAEKALVANATQYGLSHNLYKVMEEVKKDPRTQGYAAIMLCQYYKGYNSLSLEGGADAFLTSDGDFYQGNAVHYWHDSNDEYFDRWVAMLFSGESGSYTCSNASICPRAALIDGTMGNIKVSANNMRFAWIDATDGSSFRTYYCSSSFTTLWNRQAVIRGMKLIETALNLSGAISAYVYVEKMTNGYFSTADSTNIQIDGLTEVSNQGRLFYGTAGQGSIIELRLPQLSTCRLLLHSDNLTSPCATNLRIFYAPRLVNLPKFCGNNNGISNASIGWAFLIHFEIGQGFYGDLNLKMCSFANCLLTDSNNLVEDVVAHPTWSNLDQWLYNFEHLIVDKLADLSGQTAKTITLAAAPYAAITSEIRAKMSAKNWNLASA